jgi:hypothetical protein
VGRLALIALLVGAAACGHAHPAAPAWPKARAVAEGEDGGESLAPKPSAQSIDEADDEEPAAPTPAIATPAPVTAPAAAATPAATPAAAPAPDEPATGEDIVIEIDD